MTLLGLIFLLLLTLANAFVWRGNVQFANAHDFAPLQLSQGSAAHYEWDLFLWREIAAIGVTVLLFGAIGGLSASRIRRQKAHPQFARHIANRRR